MTRDTQERLLLLAAGASLALAALLLLPRGERKRAGSGRGGAGDPGREGLRGTPTPKSPPSTPPQPAWKTFGDGLRDEWSEWMERRTPPEVDPELLHARLLELPGGDRVQVGLLAPGIVEVVGTVAAPEVSRELLSAAAASPGVRTVVNRLWVEGDVE